MNDILKRNRRNEIKEARNNGGRWERRMDEKHWNQIELLEDLEEKGQIPSAPASDAKGGISVSDGQKVTDTEEGKGKMKEVISPVQEEMSEAEKAARDYQRSIALMREKARDSNDDKCSPSIAPLKSQQPRDKRDSPQREQTARDKVKQLIDSLVITERYDPSASTSSSPSQNAKSQNTEFGTAQPQASSRDPSSSPIGEGDVGFRLSKPSRKKGQQGGGLDLDDLLGFGNDQDDDDDDDEDDDDDALAGLSTNARISKSVVLTSRRGLNQIEAGLGTSSNSRAEIINQSRREEEDRKAALHGLGQSKTDNEGRGREEEDEKLTEEQSDELKRLEDEQQALDDLFAIAGRERERLKAKGEWD